MFKVEKKDEKLAKAIVNKCSDMSYAGVLTGNNPGEVWVDNLESPKAAIVFFNGQGGFQFMGEFSETFMRDNLESFVDVTAKEFLKGKANWFDFAFDDEKCLELSKDILGDRKIYESTQLVYRLKNKPHGRQANWPSRTSPGIAIDRGFISNIKNGAVSNPEFLLDYIKVWWGSTENYLEKGYGSTTVKDGKIVSYAISSAAYGDVQAIGVETLKEYRKKGLASSLVSSLLQVFKEKGIDPWWDCSEDNFASEKTALKNGLELDYKYKVCTIQYDS